jgi:branched-subunit amino acid transport protein AzlD
MTLTTTQTLIIAVMFAIGTMITRFLPFILFKGNNANNSYISYLGQVLPYAAIGMLIVYCLKGVNLIASPYGVPEAISIIIIGLLHYWKENTFLSIGVGTVMYMALVQIVFV